MISKNVNFKPLIENKLNCMILWITYILLNAKIHRSNSLKLLSFQLNQWSAILQKIFEVYIFGKNKINSRREEFAIKNVYFN